jgi:hypothetical protein
MSTFPKVDTKPLPSQDATAQEAPKVVAQTAAPQPEEYGHQQFRDFMMSDREIPIDESATKVAADGATAGETMDGAALGTDAEKKRSYFKRLYDWVAGTYPDPDAPNPVSAAENVELNDQMYDFTAKIAATANNIIVPKAIAAFSGTSTEEENRANDNEVARLEKAWGLVLRTSKKKLTPLQYLILENVLIFGMKGVGALFKYLMRISKYGFHFPWNDSWKQKEAIANATARGFHVDNLTSAPMPPAQAAAPVAPAPMPQPVQPQPLAPVAQPEPPVKLFKNAKACLQTGVLFEAGTGRPAKSKLEHNGKKLQDAFIDATAFNRYMAANGLRGLNTKKA